MSQISADHQDLESEGLAGQAAAPVNLTQSAG
jgi:hypothetical protein